jgi:hypothetical protein
MASLLAEQSAGAGVVSTAGAVEEEEDDDELVNVLCVIPACFVFRLPPRTSSAEYRYVRTPRAR